MTCLLSAYTAQKPSTITAVQTQQINTCTHLSPLYLITLFAAQDTGKILVNLAVTEMRKQFFILNKGPLFLGIKGVKPQFFLMLRNNSIQPISF